MSVIERPEIVVVEADEFLGGFDNTKYGLLLQYTNAQNLISLVYSDHVEEFCEYIGACEGDVLLREKGDELEECVLQNMHDITLNMISGQITQLRDELEDYVIDSLPELKLCSSDLHRVYFNETTAFAELTTRPRA